MDLKGKLARLEARRKPANRVSWPIELIDVKEGDPESEAAADARCAAILAEQKACGYRRRKGEILCVIVSHPKTVLGDKPLP